VKWVELQFLKLFSRWVIKKGIKMGRENLGIIFHLSEDSYKSWGPLEEEQALAKLAGRYETIVHIRVHDPSLFVRVANMATLALGDGYVKGAWDFCKDEEDIAELISRVVDSNMMQDMYLNWWNRMWYYLEFELFNMQTRTRARKVAEQHYDLGNDLYERMLDPWMQYSCGYWANSSNLNDAQLAKLELIARKLKLKPGMRVLDIGCGWGMLCKYLAENYGVECVGVTIAKEGAEYGRRVCQGLPVEIRLQDYRDLNEQFDRIVSIGMFEHVGAKNHEEYFKVAHRNLKDDGIFLLQSVGENHGNAMSYERWINKYIFPNGCIPKISHVVNGTKGKFIVEDWHNFSLDYSKTLIAWRDNFKRSWPLLEKTYGGGDFYRMWIYYLSTCESGFLARIVQLWQIVLTKDGLKNGYVSIR
jgi:cyclopropane-fatty-acyl-phospholipid synthase